jgi:hypothetical protein
LKKAIITPVFNFGSFSLPNKFFQELVLFSLEETRMLYCSSPHGGKTTNWRAGCGKTASLVRRVEKYKSMYRYYYYLGKTFF